MVDLTNFARVVALDHGLSIVSTTRADGTIQSSLVNAGVLDHPLTGEPVVGFVAIGNSLKLRLLRARPHATVAVRGGWQWATVEGPAQLIGPADPVDGIDAECQRVLLREVFTACGGTHDDWETYDRVMRDEGRTAVLVRPTRAYGVSPGRG